MNSRSKEETDHRSDGVKSVHRTCLTILLWLLAMPAAFADDERGQQLVNDFVTQVQTLQSDFEQRLVDANGEVLEETSGTLEVARPSKFRWSYTEPYEQWLVADGLNIWSYDLDLEQVTVKPQAQALANTPALLLGGSSDALDQFEYRGTTVESETVWVSMVPKDTQSGFTRVLLGFVDAQLKRMVFYDHLDQTIIQLFSSSFVSMRNINPSYPSINSIMTNMRLK